MTYREKSIIFWVIFLVIVAALLTLLIPKYGHLSSQLRASQARNLAANLSAASATNYTQRKYNPANGINIANCKDVANIAARPLPPGFIIVDQTIPPDKVALCVLRGPGIAEITFSVVGVGK